MNSIGSESENVKKNSSLTADEGKALRGAAVEHFGKTYRWNETGYLLTNGTKLDFSGRHEGGSGGYRSVDHRDILDIYPAHAQEELSGTEAMVDFMQRGNIRTKTRGSSAPLGKAAALFHASKLPIRLSQRPADQQRCPQCPGHQTEHKQIQKMEMQLTDPIVRRIPRIRPIPETISSMPPAKRAAPMA